MMTVSVWTYILWIRHLLDHSYNSFWGKSKIFYMIQIGGFWVKVPNVVNAEKWDHGSRTLTFLRWGSIRDVLRLEEELVLWTLAFNFNEFWCIGEDILYSVKTTTKLTQSLLFFYSFNFFCASLAILISIKNLVAISVSYRRHQTAVKACN